ncbi:MAG: GH92 family glycosyl hydrolase [Planctomycetota bacterium]
MPGPYLPLGLVRLGPDTQPPHRQTNGYDPGRPIARFSHTHVSGTGGQGRYGNVALTPFLGQPRLDAGVYDRHRERAAVGYYAVDLLPAEIGCELSATPRCGVHRYRFPSSAQANVLLDGGACIQKAQYADPTRVRHDAARSIGGFIERVTPSADASSPGAELVGRCDFRGGWGHDHPYSVYFAARFDTSAEVRLACGDRPRLANASKVVGADCRAVLSFGELVRPLHAKVGVSYRSIANARASLDRELAPLGGGYFGVDLDAVVRAAQDAWRPILGKIRLSGDDDLQRMIASMIYRLYCMPSDLGIDDEFGGWDSGVRQFADLYCLWDSVRNANGLLTLIDPDLQRDILNCLLDIADRTGWLPDAWVSGHAAMVQGGSSADVMLAEARLKGLGGIDYAKALHHMRRNAETPPPNPEFQGRYHVATEGATPFVPASVPHSVSRHLEYAYQDGCVAALAASLDDQRTASTYRERARHVWDLWKPQLKCFAPRHADGAWAEGFDPRSTSSDAPRDPWCYEGSSWQWSLNVHHDWAGLVERHGGRDAFVGHLDAFFDNAYGTFGARPPVIDGRRRMDGFRAKEFILHTPYLYHYAGRPDRSAQTVRMVLERYYAPRRDGLSDDEDMGSHAAFYLCSCVGLYPVMGQDLYWLVPPRADYVELEVGPDGHRLTIEAPGAAEGRPHIASARLAGRALDRSWLRHRELLQAAEQGQPLQFQLAAAPTGWGRDTPPGPLDD